MTGLLGHEPGQNCQDRAARIELPAQHCKDKTTTVGQNRKEKTAGKDRHARQLEGS
jgi:hypothetical protein